MNVGVFFAITSVGVALNFFGVWWRTRPAKLAQLMTRGVEDHLLVILAEREARKFGDEIVSSNYESLRFYQNGKVDE